MPRHFSVCAKAALLVSAALLFLAGGCSPLRFGGSRERVVEWAEARGFRAGDIEAGSFRLLVLRRIQKGNQDGVLTVYIEGDGAPWLSAYHPPRDPTPLSPIALALADKESAANLVYLGRPCQYLDRKSLASCDSDWWAGRRFAPEVLAAYSAVLDRLRIETGSNRIHLRGHSGGGVLAALLASRRDDVAQLVTVASPLALKVWTEWHRVSPMTASLDPIEEQGRMPAALHLAGADDRVVPPAVLEAYVARRGGILRVHSDYDHTCCWDRNWPELLNLSPTWEDIR